MSITYADIQPFDVDDRTDAEIATAMAASRLTVRNIPIGDLYLAAIDWGVIVLAPGSRELSGPLIDIATNHPDAAVRAKLSRLLAALSPDSSRSIYTSSDMADAAIVGSLADQLLTADQRTELATLSGGERYADVTESDVTEAKATRAADLARAALSARLLTAYDAAQTAISEGGDAAAVKAAFDAAWAVGGGE